MTEKAIPNGGRYVTARQVVAVIAAVAALATIHTVILVPAIMAQMSPMIDGKLEAHEGRPHAGSITTEEWRILYERMATQDSIKGIERRLQMIEDQLNR